MPVTKAASPTTKKSTRCVRVGGTPGPRLKAPRTSVPIRLITIPKIPSNTSTIEVNISTHHRDSKRRLCSGTIR
jgi:hypothetical protein